MTIAELFNAIESHKMAAEVNIASSRRLANEIVRSHPIVRELADKMKKPRVTERIFLRLLGLTSQATDPRYENPSDIALLAYLLLLSWRDRQLALIAGSAVCQMPNLWWASKMATDILERRSEQNEMAGETSTPVAANTHAGDRLFLADPRSFLTAAAPPYLFRIRHPNLTQTFDPRTRTVPGGIRRVASHSTSRFEPEAAAA